MFERLKRLAGQSLVYGLGGVVSRVLAVLLLPIYTRYLTREDLGAVGVIIALSAILVTVLRGGMSSAFFRFYFDSAEEDRRRRVTQTAFWFTMTTATAGLLAGLVLAEPLAQALALDDPNLVRAGFAGIWAQMNYEQLTALFRVEQRPGAFVAASLVNVAITIGATLLLVVAYDMGALGVLIGNFTGTLAVYAGLLAYRRSTLGLSFDGSLRREMNRFGLPLVPSALFLWVTNFSDRFFLARLSSLAEVGLYEIGVRIASAALLLLTAFRTAWPAFAYSIEDEEEARRTYAHVLTYLVFAVSWLALALGVLSPWLVRLLAQPPFYEGHRAVAPLAFAAVAFGGYIVVAIGSGRARRTQFNWVVSGIAAVVNVALNLALIPRYGMLGAAAATIAAYSVLFVAMTWYSQRVYPVPYEWRRVATLVATAVALTVAAKVFEIPLAAALLVAAAYPLALLPAGFYSRSERARLLRLRGRLS